MSRVRRIERGFKGHFICADLCRWSRVTDVGRYRVSSIGELYLPNKNERALIGAARYLETLVFILSDEICNCGCMAPKIKRHCEIDSDGYQEIYEADKGHERMVRKYLAIANKEATHA